MTSRRTLPNRRGGDIFDMFMHGAKFAVSVGCFDQNKPAEVFITGAKAGSEVQAVARDAAILLSLSLQYGCPLEVIKHAITRNADDSPQTLIGAVIDLMEEKGYQ